jgi:ribosomal protein S18 acetylase RimI-like enzyme
VAPTRRHWGRSLLAVRLNPVATWLFSRVCCSVIEYRQATSSDTKAIAALHADSWRRHYRGSYSDTYLDGDVDADLFRLWSARLRSPDPTHDTIVAYDEETLVGFVHTILDADPTLGALIDNLHVSHGRQRLGIGTELMARAADFVIRAAPGKGLHLLVLERNRRARAFYESVGGVYVDREPSEAPGGGTIIGLRYVWADPDVLLWH